MALELVFSIGIVAFLVIFLATRLEQNEHGALRFLLIGFFFILLIIMGKAGVDYKDNCVTFIENQTVSQGGNFTNFGYGYQCIPTTNKTADQFYKTTIYLFWFFIIYVFLFIFWKILIINKKTAGTMQKLSNNFKRFNK